MKYLKLLVVFCALLLFAAPANALSIIPSNADYSGYVDPPNQENVWEAIASFISPLDPKFPLYKAEVGNEDNPATTEEGPLAESYQTVFTNEPLDPADARISYVVGGPAIDTSFAAWLLVKDGRADPNWYLFYLQDLDWNGTDDLELTGFWPGTGAISNVSLYGSSMPVPVSLYGSSMPVPEPATMLLLGFGLVGLAIAGRRNFLK